MLAKRLHSWLIPAAAPTPAQVWAWLWVSVAIALAHSIPVLHEAFSDAYIVQDDARQHVFWMQRFVDPSLFPNDLLADYFQSVAPLGYTAFYWVFIRLGIDPLLLSKLIPPLLGFATTVLAYRLCLQLLPIPMTGAIAALLTNQVIWSHDDLASASPRAFMLPLFLGFLYGLVQRRIWVCGGLMALMGLFYPQFVFVCAGLLVVRLGEWRHGRLSVVGDRQTWLLSLSGLLIAVLVLLPFALSTSAYGPVITAAEARQLPDFFAGGRSVFFGDDFYKFWISGMRSGLFPTLKPPLLALGLVLPLLLRFPQRFPLAKRVQHLSLLGQLPLVAIALFFAAHLLLFRLHLPSRYSSYPLRFTLLFAAALSLSLLIDATLRHWSQRPRSLVSGGGVLLLCGLLLFYPLYDADFPKTNYLQGRLPQTYAFLAQQPKDIRVASLLRDADMLPTFSLRSVWVAREYLIPYHLGYAQAFRDRMVPLIQAHYAIDPAPLEAAIRTDHLDYWLLNEDSFNPQELRESWLRQYPGVLQTALRNLGRREPALARLAPRCQVLEEDGRRLIASQCLLENLTTLSEPPPNSVAPL